MSRYARRKRESQAIVLTQWEQLEVWVNQPIGEINMVMIEGRFYDKTIEKDREDLKTLLNKVKVGT